LLLETPLHPLEELKEKPLKMIVSFF
jgi:hypothetical protein